MTLFSAQPAWNTVTPAAHLLIHQNDFKIAVFQLHKFVIKSYQKITLMTKGVEAMWRRILMIRHKTGNGYNFGIHDRICTKLSMFHSSLALNTSA